MIINEEAVIGNLMKLLVNVRGLIGIGHSEHAMNAIDEARQDGWRKMGWKTLLEERDVARLQAVDGQ